MRPASTRACCATSPPSASWHPTQVLNHRLGDRPVTAADVVASSFPTAVTSAPLPRGLVDDRTGTDLGSARELARRTAAPAAANRAAARPASPRRTPLRSAH